MKILLIDDDRDDQALFGDAARQIIPDAEIEVVDNGVLGLQRLGGSSQLPEIVFLDINMPLMDGRETLSAIRSSPRLGNLDVVIYSTSITQYDQSLFEKQGASCIVKPNSFDELVNLLREELLVKRETVGRPKEI